jgi:3D (Asp-Asp-Asp) domain-containing protein
MQDLPMRWWIHILLFSHLFSSVSWAAASSKNRTVTAVKAVGYKAEPKPKSEPRALATKEDREMDRPGEVWVPDGDGGGRWYPVSPGSRLMVGDYKLGPKITKLISQLPGQPQYGSRQRSQLAAITCYWRYGRDTDKWTRQGQSSTGVKLAMGVVAVDPKIIPYGSLVTIEGVPGIYLAADCGSHVTKRVAAKRTARSAAERGAIVVDVFFPTERAGRAFDSRLPKFVTVKWVPPVYPARMIASRN